MYKYIHIMRPNELKFLGPLVEMINNPDNGFVREDHLFVTPHKQVYEVLGIESNVILDESKVNLVNKYAPKCKWIVSHDMPGIKETLRIKRKYLRKIIWRTWGGSHQKYNYREESFFVSIKHRFEDFVYKSYLKLTFGKGIIGVANSVDIVDIRKWLKKTPLYRMPYVSLDQYPIMLEVAAEEPVVRQKKRIMLGHQGTESEHHLEILKKLATFNDDEVEIFVPLSYGTRAYIEYLIKEIDNKKRKNIIVIRDYMDFKAYSRFLNSMDLIILDEESSMALGNIAMLLFLEKTIMLNSKGVIAQVFKNNNIPFYCTEELERFKIDDLKPLKYNGKDNDLVFHEYEYYIKCWHTFFEEIEKC